METQMVYRIADNIVSPLGVTTAENYQAVKAGGSALCRYDHRWQIPEPFTASLFTETQNRALATDGLTRFESLAYASAQRAIEAASIKARESNVVFILSTTKGNIELLEQSSGDDTHIYPGTAARHVAERLGITTQPITVCNACISGISAIILAMRLIEAGRYDYAVVCGADVQNKFTVSGFQSLKAVDENACRPFDIERLGLNLGEAAATIVLGRERPTADSWAIQQGAVRNDAFHISSPSKNGEGARLALSAVTKDADTGKLAFINAHGTATLFNDQMESVALAATGLSQTPTNSLKGYFGHTLGASGILETIITMHSVASGELPATRGFSESGVSGKMTLSASPMAVSGHSFVKVISGFGGCNAALYCTNTPPTPSPTENVAPTTLRIMHSVEITPSRVTIDGRECPIEGEGADILTWIYKNHIGSYPKFYKMDRLSQLGFVASELLLAQEDPRKGPCTDRAVVLFNHSSSVCADRAFAQTIVPGEDYYPSPSLFVGTLPNIVCGEIAIRHGYHSETSFYIMSEKDESMINKVIQSTFLDKTVHSMVTGWVDYQDNENFETKVMIIEH